MDGNADIDWWCSGYILIYIFKKYVILRFRNCIWRNTFWFMLGIRCECTFRDILGYSGRIIQCWILKENFILALLFQHLSNFNLTRPWLFIFRYLHFFFLCYSVFQSLCSFVSPILKFNLEIDQTRSRIWDSACSFLSNPLFFLSVHSLLFILTEKKNRLTRRRTGWLIAWQYVKT